MDKILIKNKVYILMIAGILVVIGLIWYLVLPKYRLLQTTKTTYNQKVNELLELNKKSQHLSQKSAEIKKLAGQIEELDNLIPSGINEADLIVELTSLADQSGVTVLNYSFNSDTQKTKKSSSEKVVKKSAFTKIPIPLQVTGSYSAIENYLNRLLNLERIFSIESISFSTGDDEQSSASITAVTYSL